MDQVTLLTLLRAARAVGMKIAAEGNRVAVTGPKHARRIAEALLEREPDVIAILGGHGPFSEWSDEAAQHFLERLTIAADLGMDTSPGSEAWNIAVREAQRVEAGVPIAAWTRNANLIDTTLAAFGSVGMTLTVAPTETCEEPPPVSTCRACGHSRWWRPINDPAPDLPPSPASGWTCACCHPPVMPLNATVFHGGNP